MSALAHNTWTSGEGVPVVIENPEHYPFEPGDREENWHEASDEEYAAYEAYWDAADREENPDAWVDNRTEQE